MEEEIHNQMAYADGKQRLNSDYKLSNQGGLIENGTEGRRKKGITISH